MPYDKFLIAPLTQGVQQNVKPWLLLDESFQQMKNMYTWRGSVKKRVGGRVMNGSKGEPQNQLFTRLRINIGTTDGNGDLAGNIPGVVTADKVGMAFSCGDEVFTVTTAGTPGVMLTTGAATIHTFDTTSGAYVIAGADATTDVYFYPSDPVMALSSYEILGANNTSVESLLAFDTQFAYKFVYANGWNREATGTSTWTGTNSDFLWTCNYRGAASQDYLMFVTNNISADAMRYWTGTTFTAWGSAGTTPINAGGNFIKTCKIITPFKDRLLLLNVTENISGSDAIFRNRVRFSQNGSPIDNTAWRQDIVGKGGYIEAPVKESIVSVENLKDRLIVFFERSTWELVYTGNEVLPFRFQQIDTDLGVESVNSVIPFDKVVLGFGDNGIHASNGINVDRIDNMIPDTIYDVSNSNSGPERVNGIRDYWIENVYWSFPSTNEQDGNNNTFPNRVLVYDYNYKTWSFNDDSITVFGNFYLEQSITWADISAAWEDMDDIWNDPSMQERFKSVIAGNQQGYTFIVDSKRNSNSVALQITDIAVSGAVVTFTCYNHNLSKNSYVYFSGIQDSAAGNMATDGVINSKIYKINTTDSDTFTINTGETAITGTYSGGGVVTRVSELNLTTTQYNFYNKTGTNIAYTQVDFLVDKTSSGQIKVDFYPSSSNRNLVKDGSSKDGTGSAIGTSILETSPYTLVPLESTQDRFWHSIYVNATGENVQLQLSLSEDQILDPAIAFSDFQLNAMMFYVTKTNQFGG